MSITSPDAPRLEPEGFEVAETVPMLSLRWYGGPPPRQSVAPTVVTGVFDVLHPGHVRFLTWAAARGRPLYVGIEDDERVRHWKGPGRPLHTRAERAEVLSALKAVSMVFSIFGDPSVCQADDYVRLLRRWAQGPSPSLQETHTPRESEPARPRWASTVWSSPSRPGIRRRDCSIDAGADLMRQNLTPSTDTPLQAALREIDLGRSGASYETLLAVTELAIEIAREGARVARSARSSRWARRLKSFGIVVR